MFRQKIKNSFMLVKDDILEFKQNVTEWFHYFNRKNSELEARVAFLENKITEMEQIIN